MSLMLTTVKIVNYLFSKRNYYLRAFKGHKLISFVNFDPGSDDVISVWAMIAEKKYNSIVI